MNKLCKVASCWTYIEILLGAHPILHISRIRVKNNVNYTGAPAVCPHGVNEDTYTFYHLYD
jgi:hypothetical protein